MNETVYTEEFVEDLQRQIGDLEQEKKDLKAEVLEMKKSIGRTVLDN